MSSIKKDEAITSGHHHQEHLDKEQAQEAAIRSDYEQVAQFIAQMERDAAASTSKFNAVFKEPKHYTWALVAFASMGGLLSGLDQSVISGANLFLPIDLSLSERQNSLVNAGMPLGAVGGALVLSPCNEYLGRR